MIVLREAGVSEDLRSATMGASYMGVWDFDVWLTFPTSAKNGTQIKAFLMQSTSPGLGAAAPRPGDVFC